MDLKDRIIAESLRLFSMKGFLSTSIHDIIEAAGTSKGGLYNHFKDKEAILSAVLEEARDIWKEGNLKDLDKIGDPLLKIQKLLVNFRDRYLKDNHKLPGGCIFVTLSVELDDQIPHMAREVNRGFEGIKEMINACLEQGVTTGKVRSGIDTRAVTDMIVSVTLGASVMYGVDKKASSANRPINAVIDYLESLRP